MRGDGEPPTPGELSTTDPTAAGATTAVSTPDLFSLTLSALVGAQQSPVAVNTEGTPSFGPYMSRAKFTLHSIGLYCRSR